MRHFITIYKQIIQILPHVKGNNSINKQTLPVINLKKQVFEKKDNQNLKKIEINKLLLLP